MSAAEVSSGADRRWWGMAVIATAILLSAIDTTIVNVALPDIARDLDAGLNELQWVIDAFLVTLSGALLVGGAIADRFGRRKVFLSGFAAFAGASAVAAAAQTPEALIAARVLMALAVACILPPALALLSVMFAPEERPRAVAIWAAVGGIGLALGPIAGGVLVDAVGWRWVFLVNVPIALLAVPAGLRLLPESWRPGVPPLDVVGAVLSVLALGGIVFALIEGVDRGWLHPAVIVAIVVGLAAGTAFVRLELRLHDPIVDVRILANPTVQAGVAGLMALYGSLMGMLFLVPQYLEHVQGRSAFVSGVVLAPIGAAIVATSPLAARLEARIGAQTAMGAGLCGMALGFLPMLLLAPDGSPVVVAVGALLYGLAAGVTVTPATATIIDALGAEKAGDAAEANMVARQVGGALGVALVGSLVGLLGDDLSATAATRWGLVLSAAFAAAAAAVALLRPGR